MRRVTSREQRKMYNSIDKARASSIVHAPFPPPNALTYFLEFVPGIYRFAHFRENNAYTSETHTHVHARTQSQTLDAHVRRLCCAWEKRRRVYRRHRDKNHCAIYKRSRKTRVRCVGGRIHYSSRGININARWAHANEKIR